MDFYHFYTGKEFEAYQFLGAHPAEGGFVFRTFAPSAVRISVIGEFNHWQETPMQKIYDGNFWECAIANAEPGQMYKYRIYRKDGSFIDHADPYAFCSELRPQSASILSAQGGYSFRDASWLSKQKGQTPSAINIYEIHFGSWKKKEAGEGENGWYNYREMAPLLIPYLKEQNYNYVELMPLNEYPCDESWGYQATGFFAPTSRYGAPEDLKFFINQCHQNGIGVLLDFVTVHFAVNDYALWNYDGTALYEYPHTDVGYNEWGSCNFMHSRGEVCSFLQSSAYYWLKEFHFDGLRLDAVGNLVYWQGDSRRGENIPSIRFLQTMNAGLKERLPDVLLIAEDSTARPGVTAPVSSGGLGFDYKWDLGWMNDTLDYFRKSPAQRSEAYHTLTFSMHYFYNERYLLPLSHDEVVHGKATIIQKMYGEYEDKFRQARALYLYMYAHPGLKLNFMGNEFAQFREWDERREQDWDILRFPLHDAFHRFQKELSGLYLKHPALSELDYSREGFQWVENNRPGQCLYAFERKSPSERILALFNFSDQEQEYLLPNHLGQNYELLIASDMDVYGGEHAYTKAEKQLSGTEIRFRLAPYSGRYYVIGVDKR